MTSIAGVVFADRERPAPRDLGAGRVHPQPGLPAPEVFRWVAGNVSLLQVGGTACHDDNGTPRAARLPLRIVADARIDNRAELAVALGQPASSDAALILAAYEKWGPDCPARFVGDFAFAIWDAAAGRLFCARDQLGVRPFCYRCDADGFAFASEPRTLQRPGEPLNDNRIAAYLAGFDDDYAETVFAGIQRLPPAHSIVFHATGMQVQRYWTLEPDDVAPDCDFAAGLRDRLVRAVDDRLIGTAAPGAMLSGGLDSSSIVGAAAHRHGGEPDFRLATFSFAYPQTPQFDEQGYVEAMLERYRLAPTYVAMDDLAPLDGLPPLNAGGNDLVFGPGLPKIARVLAAARRAGIDTVLDGHGGDEVVSHGYGRLRELAREGRWGTLYRELRGVSQVFGESPERLLLQYYFGHGFGRRLRNARDRLLPQFKTAARSRGAAGLGLVGPDLAAATGIAERHSAWRSRLATASTSEHDLQLWNISGPGAVRALEALANVGQHAGVELRFPFFDRRVVSFAIATPDREKLRDGWSRSVLRRAMAGILPDKVQWRRSKVDFAPELARGLARHHQPLLEHAADADGPLAGIVDLARLRQLTDAFLDNPEQCDGAELFALWRAIALSLWLEGRATRVPRQQVAS